VALASKCVWFYQVTLGSLQGKIKCQRNAKIVEGKMVIRGNLGIAVTKAKCLNIDTGHNFFKCLFEPATYIPSTV